MSYAPPPPPPPPSGPSGPSGPYGPMPGYGGQGMPPKPNSYLVWGILSALLCCLPFGIVSIVQAAKVDGLYMSGQFAEAQRVSDSARKWAIIAAVSGIVVLVVYVALAALAGFSTDSTTTGF